MQIINQNFITRMIAAVSAEAIDEIILDDYISKIQEKLIIEFATPLSIHMLNELQVDAESEELDHCVQNYV